MPSQCCCAFLFTFFTFLPSTRCARNGVVLSARRRSGGQVTGLTGSQAQGSGCSYRKPIHDGLFNPSTSLRLTRRIPLGPEEAFPFAFFGFRRCAQGAQMTHTVLSRIIHSSPTGRAHGGDAFNPGGLKARRSGQQQRGYALYLSPVARPLFARFFFNFFIDIFSPYCF